MTDYLSLIDEDTDISIINEFSNGITLFPNQMKDVKKSVMMGSGVWTVEMGLGKTIMTVGVANLLTPILNKGGFMIVSADSNTVESFRNYMVNNTGLKVYYTTGEAAKVAECIRLVESGQVNCIVCTHSAWRQSLDFNIFMYNNIKNVVAMVYDECKGTEDNQGFQNFIEMSRYVKYVYPAHATPLNNGVQVLRDLLYATKATDLTLRQFKKKYCYYEMVGENQIENIKSDEIKKDFGQYLINTNRKDVGAETKYATHNFRRAVLTPLQRDAYEKKVDAKAKILYGLSSAAQMPAANPALLELIQAVTCIPPTENKVVFCWRIETAEVVASLFKMMGITVMQLNGHQTPTPAEKSYIEEEFNNTPGALLITSAYTGNNLNQANHIIVYETPADIGQYIARIARGYASKEVHLDWIYYPELDRETLYKALNSCIDNDVINDRDLVLANIIMDEILESYPEDPRNEGLLRKLNRL